MKASVFPCERRLNRKTGQDICCLDDLTCKFEVCLSVSKPSVW